MKICIGMRKFSAPVLVLKGFMSIPDSGFQHRIRLCMGFLQLLVTSKASAEVIPCDSSNVVVLEFKKDQFLNSPQYHNCFCTTTMQNQYLIARIFYKRFPINSTFKCHLFFITFVIFPHSAFP